MRYSSIIKKYIFVDIFFWIVQIVNTDELIKCCSYTKILSTATFEMLHLKSLCCRQCQGWETLAGRNKSRGWIIFVYISDSLLLNLVTFD